MGLGPRLLFLEGLAPPLLNDDKNGVTLHVRENGHRKDFFQGGTIGFFQQFF